MDVDLTGRDAIAEDLEREAAQVQERIAALSGLRAELSAELGQLVKERDRIFRNLAHLRRTSEGGIG